MADQRFVRFELQHTPHSFGHCFNLPIGRNRPFAIFESRSVANRFQQHLQFIIIILFAGCSRCCEHNNKREMTNQKANVTILAIYSTVFAVRVANWVISVHLILVDGTHVKHLKRFRLCRALVRPLSTTKRK